jgi:hypothetical protein
MNTDSNANCSSKDKGNVYVLPFAHSGEEIFYDVHSHQDERIRPFITLREEIEEAGYTFRVTRTAENLKDPVAILSLCNIYAPVLDNLCHYPKEICSLLVPEPPILHPWLYDSRLTNVFGTIFVMFDELVDNSSYFKFHHHQGRTSTMKNIPSFEEKKFCIMIQSNLLCSEPGELYSKRKEAADFFALEDGFDLYGSGWEGNAAWKGRHDKDKLELLRQYRFHLCYENMENQRGFVTERIFESFYGGCVPVYWGASNIEKYVPKECFIDRRDFSSNEELCRYLRQVDQKSYDSYLEAAQRFLKTPEAALFSPKGFAKTIMNRILPNNR